MNSPATATAPTGVGRNFLKLGAGEAMARVVAFGATVYLARTLGAPTYGVIVLATAILLYLTFLTDCGVEMLGVQEVAADRTALLASLPDVLGARLLVGIALIAFTIALGLLVMPQPEGAILAAYSLTLVTVGLGTRWVHLGLEHAGRAALVRVASEGLIAVMIVVAVRTPADLVRVPVAQLVGEGLGALLLLRMLPTGARGLRVRLRPVMVASLLSRSWPMVLHAMLGLAIFNSDFIFLRILRDSATLGFYAASYTLISFFLNLGTAYTMSLIPAMTRLRGDPAAGRALYDTSMAQVLAGALPVCVGGILVADQVVALVYGAAYAAAAEPLRILLLLLPLAYIRNVSQGAIVAHGRQDQLLRTVAWAAVTNVVLNVALIPRWGLAGAAWATVVTEAVRTGLALVYAQRLALPMTHPRRFVRVAVATAAMGTGVAAAGSLSLLPVMALGAGVYVTSLALVGGLRFRAGALPELVV